MEKDTFIDIGEIGNSIGGLSVKKSIDGNFYWGIQNHFDLIWEEIPKELYDNLVKFENERIKDE